MVVNQQALASLKIGYSTAFNKGFEGAPICYEQIATIVPSSTGSQEYAWIGQMPGMKEWIGEREIQQLAAHEYTIKNKDFEMTLGVPRKDIEDDQYGVYTPMFTQMGESAKRHPQLLVFKTLKSGFEALCYDGKPFFSADHKQGKTTYSNLGTDKLSPESYEEARSKIQSITGDKEESLGLVPDLLVVSPKNEKAAKLILEAEQINGTSNVNRGTAKILVVPELAGAGEDAWYLLCTSRFMKPIIYQVRKPIVFVSLTNETDTNVFLNNQYLYGADGRGNAGFGFWQMAYGSTGINAG